MSSKMNRDAYLQFHENFCNASRALSAQKNNDYAGKDGEEPFANFTRVETMGICSTEQGFMVRLTDKLSRLATLAAGGKLQVTDETAQDTLKDVVNYAILLAAYMADAETTGLMTAKKGPGMSSTKEKRFLAKEIEQRLKAGLLKADDLLLGQPQTEGTRR